MAFVATPQFDTPVLSARAVNALSSWQNYLHRQGKLSTFPQELYDNTATSGTNAYVEVERAWLIHRHVSGYTEYLYYDISITKNEAGGNPVYVRVFWKTITPGTTANAVLTLEQSDFGTTRHRGRVALADLPTAETHPANGDAIEVAVYAYRSSDASPIACQGIVYWLDEELWPEDYTALDDATALTDDEDEDVPDDLGHLAANCEVLDVLAQGYVPGFRSVEVDGAGYEFTSRTMATWRWITNMDGRMYYRVALWKTQGSASSAIRIRFYVNTDYLVHTVSLTAGYFMEDPYIEEGYFTLSGFAPTPIMQMGIRIHAVIDATGDAGGGGTVYYLYEDGPGASGYADFGQAIHTQQVNGDSGSNKLRTLWTNQKIIAGDNGGGYGSNGFDVSAGFPVGYALLASRAAAMHRGWCDHVSHDAKGRQYIIHVDGVEYQAIYLRRLLYRDYLYYRGKGVELVYVDANGDETAERLDDFDEDNPYQVASLADIANMIHGRIFYLRTPVRDDEENVLDFAYAGYL